MKVNVKRFITVLILLMLTSFVSGFIVGKAFSQKQPNREIKQQAPNFQERESKSTTLASLNQYNTIESDLKAKNAG